MCWLSCPYCVFSCKASWLYAIVPSYHLFFETLIKRSLTWPPREHLFKYWNIQEKWGPVWRMNRQNEGEGRDGPIQKSWSTGDVSTLVSDAWNACTLGSVKLLRTYLYKCIRWESVWESLCDSLMLLCSLGVRSISIPQSRGKKGGKRKNEKCNSSQYQTRRCKPEKAIPSWKNWTFTTSSPRCVGGRRGLRRSTGGSDELLLKPLTSPNAPPCEQK